MEGRGGYSKERSQPVSDCPRRVAEIVSRVSTILCVVLVDECQRFIMPRRICYSMKNKNVEKSFIHNKRTCQTSLCMELMAPSNFTFYFLIFCIKLLV